MCRNREQLGITLTRSVSSKDKGVGVLSIANRRVLVAAKRDERLKCAGRDKDSRREVTIARSARKKITLKETLR